jgi:hypothetical protein
VPLLLALITQLAIAVVHLEKLRSQAAALFIFTLAAVSLLGLLAIHEAPSAPAAAPRPDRGRPAAGSDDERGGGMWQSDRHAPTPADRCVIG